MKIAKARLNVRRVDAIDVLKLKRELTSKGINWLLGDYKVMGYALSISLSIFAKRLASSSTFFWH